jgi:hypothetical protein
MLVINWSSPTSHFFKILIYNALLKIKQTLPQRYFALLRSYLQHRYLVVSYNNINSAAVIMHSGFHKGASWALFYKHYIRRISLKPPQPPLARSQTIRQLWQPTQTQPLLRWTSKPIYERLNTGHENCDWKSTRLNLHISPSLFGKKPAHHFTSIRPSNHRQKQSNILASISTNSSPGENIFFY